MIFYIVSAVSSVRDGVKITLLSDEKAEKEKKESLLLTEKSYQMLGAPQKGRIYSQEDAAPLFRAHRRYEAVRRALMILGAFDQSEKMLYRKLRERHFAHEDALFALAYVKKRGLIREKEQLARLVVRLANEKLYGRARITSALVAKGYRSSDIGEALQNALSEGEIDFAENLRTLFEKKKAQDALARKKLAYNYGYSSANID